MEHILILTAVAVVVGGLGGKFGLHIIDVIEIVLSVFVFDFYGTHYHSEGVVGVVGALGGKLRLWCRVLMGAGQCSGVNHQHLIKSVMMRLMTKTKNIKN